MNSTISLSPSPVGGEQSHHDASHGQRLTFVSRQLQFVFQHLSGLAFSDLAKTTALRASQLMMLPNDERRLPIRDRIQKLERAEVAIRDPQLLGLQRLDDRVQGRAFLSMSILDGDDVRHRTSSRIEHHQRLARQRSRCLRTRLHQAMLCGGERIAVEDPLLVTRDWLVREYGWHALTIGKGMGATIHSRFHALPDGQGRATHRCVSSSTTRTGS